MSSLLMLKKQFYTQHCRGFLINNSEEGHFGVDIISRLR